MMALFEIFCLCVLIMVVLSHLFAEPLKEEARPLVWESWSQPFRLKCGRGLSDYRVMSAAVLAIFVILYIVFR